MAVPVTTQHTLADRSGHPIAVGDTVRVKGMTEPATVHWIDPRYGVLVVLTAGRANQQMGRMVRVQDVEKG